MHGTNDSAALVAMMKETAKAMMTLRNEMEQREKRMQDAIHQELQSLRSEVSETRRGVATIVNGARERLTEDGKAAFAPAAAEMHRSVADTSAHLRSASKAVWMWYAGLVVLAVLIAVVAWGVLGYYQSELAQAKNQLERYENAVPVVQAFAASDVVLCDGRICVNVDQKGERRGDKQQYAPAKPRQ